MGDKHSRGVLVGASILNPNPPGRIANNNIHPKAKSKNGLLTASVNVNGRRSHLDEIKVLVRSIGIDILALNETKLRQSTQATLN